MTSAQIRQSFLDFFQSKQHTIVPSSSLMPDSPNLLFTNAGMNQFVPIFLGQVKCPYTPGRAADTQKCIRAGGKHNDLEDVGLDTYHHTFFEMLGNWSFGDYFKKEAIEWAWELITEVWKFPKERLYATVYQPGPGEPSEFDQEAYDHWARLFTAAGLDPKIHIVSGGKKDNFWMMGDTGPCGPCSELHVDLTQNGDTKGALVNKGSSECIEIWNLVFMQFNANPDGTFTPLPAKSVDTGMGFERVTSIMQCTKDFTDFGVTISNYETDIFRPIFDKLEQLSGKKYGSTLPGADKSAASNPQSAIDVAFRVIADHIRTLSFAIADGIQPGNSDRNYVLRRILRRAVRYGRSLGFHEPFFYKLVAVTADTMGDVFPEIRAKQKHVEAVIRAEEEAFNKTLDTGIRIYDQIVALEEALEAFLVDATVFSSRVKKGEVSQITVAFGIQNFAFKVQKLIRNIDAAVWDRVTSPEKQALKEWADNIVQANAGENSGLAGFDPAVTSNFVETNADTLLAKLGELASNLQPQKRMISGSAAFLLYDEKGFPLDLTELMARERGLTVDVAGFNELMEKQKARARAAQKKTVIELSQIETQTPTEFVGYEKLETPAKVLEVVSLKNQPAVVLDTSACYAEMGGQVGDAGELAEGSRLWRIANTQKSGSAWLHLLENGGAKSDAGSDDLDAPVVGAEVTLSVDRDRRAAIQRHHTVTHLLHWALHEVVSKDASQKGSFVGPDKLTFDFNSAPLTPPQVADIERLVNERIVENAPVSWLEAKYNHVKIRDDIMQFFGEKYGDWVRVVQVGGRPTSLDGYSMELCGGTHCRATGEIGLFRIVAENAIAAGVRRIEAVAGLEAYRKAADELQLIKAVAGKVNSPVGELEKKIENLLAQQKELEKQLKLATLRNASNAASELLGRAVAVNGIPLITHNLGDADGEFLQAIADALKGRFQGVIVLGGGSETAVTLVAAVTPEFTAKVQAGKLIQQIAPVVGGRGGGRPDNARGGGKDAGKLDAALAKVRSLLG